MLEAKSGKSSSGSNFVRGSPLQLPPSVSLFANDGVEEVIG